MNFGKKSILFCAFIFVSLFFLANVSASLSDGLRLYYDMSSSKELVSGTYNLGYYHGTMVYSDSSCLIGNCSQYDLGRNNYLPANADTNLGAQKDISLNFWVRVVNGDNGGPLVFYRQDGGGISVGDNSNSIWYFSGQWTGNVIKTTFANNQWFMITYVKNATRYGKIYVNGHEIREGQSALSDENSDISLGTLGEKYDMRGQMDEMGWWNRTLSNSEIEELYNSGAGKQPQFDITPPNIQIVYPQNYYYYKDVTELDYAASDDIQLESCWYSTDNGKTNSTVTCGENVTGLTSIEGNNTWTIWAKDSAGNINSSSVTFIKDITVPGATLISPRNSATIYSTFAFFTANFSDDFGLAKTTGEIWDTSGKLVSARTISLNGGKKDIANISMQFPKDGTYFWNFLVKDLAGNVAFAPKNLTFFVSTAELFLTNKDISFSDNKPMKNDIVTITATFNNSGTYDPQNITVGFYDGSPNDGGTPIGFANLSNYRSDSYFVQMDWKAVEGSHDIYVYLDPFNQIDEFNETNNIAFAHLNVSTLPDLVIGEKDIGFSNSKPKNGEKIKIYTMVHNYESPKANNFSVLFYLDNDKNKIIAERNLSLGGHQTQKLEVLWNAIEGNHTIYVFADYKNKIKELNETNNIGFKEIYVKNEPFRQYMNDTEE